MNTDRQVHIQTDRYTDRLTVLKTRWGEHTQTCTQTDRLTVSCRPGGMNTDRQVYRQTDSQSLVDQVR